MSSIPCRCLCEGFVQEMIGTAHELTLERWRLFKDAIESYLDDFNEEEQSWRTYCGVFDWLPDLTNAEEVAKTDLLPGGFYFHDKRVFQIQEHGPETGQHTAEDLGRLVKDQLRVQDGKIQRAYCVPQYGSSYYNVVHDSGTVERLPQVDHYIRLRYSSVENLIKLQGRLPFDIDEEAKRVAMDRGGAIVGGNLPMPPGTQITLIAVLSEKALDIVTMRQEFISRKVNEEKAMRRKQFEALKQEFEP